MTLKKNGTRAGAGMARVHLVAGIIAVAGMWTSVAVADQFHYNNVVVGTRAVGMGGAFGAVADDASGVYYNPAGLAFALSNDISGSANAFYSKTTTYENALGSDDFVEESSGSVPSFFGGLQKLDRYVDGLVFAFGVYSIDSDLKDQDTLIEDLTLGASEVDHYHRTANARASTSFMGAAAGLRVTNSLALGFGLSYLNADELVQDYQHIVQTDIIKDKNDTNIAVVKYYSEANRQRLTVHGVQAALGAQMALPGNFAVGLTFKPAFIASQRLEFASEKRTNYLTAAGAEALNNAPNSTTVSPGLKFTDDISAGTSKKPIGAWPTEVRLGFAWFASPSLLMALDVNHYTESKGGMKIYEREAVTNLALGTEYYLTPALPLRLGIFTNNDARPEVQKGTVTATDNCKNADFRAKYCGQPDHVDYMGESVFIAWVQPNSQIAVGVVLQQGKGQAQKTGDHLVQDVKASSTTFAFSATHNL